MSPEIGVLDFNFSLQCYAHYLNPLLFLVSVFWGVFEVFPYRCRGHSSLQKRKICIYLNIQAPEESANMIFDRVVFQAGTISTWNFTSVQRHYVSVNKCLPRFGNMSRPCPLCAFQRNLTKIDNNKNSFSTTASLPNRATQVVWRNSHLSVPRVRRTPSLLTDIFYSTVDKRLYFYLTSALFLRFFIWIHIVHLIP